MAVARYHRSGQVEGDPVMMICFPDSMALPVLQVFNIEK